jgi:hypothetical protein
MQNPDKGTEISEIYRCINWIETQPRKVVGGRNFSVVWDAWRNQAESSVLAAALESDTNMYKLRRCKNEFKSEADGAIK